MDHTSSTVHACPACNLVSHVTMQAASLWRMFPSALTAEHLEHVISLGDSLHDFLEEHTTHGDSEAPKASS